MNPTATNKLTARQVSDARRLRAAGASLASIAVRFGVTGAAIGYHVRDIKPDRLLTVRRVPKHTLDPDAALRMFAFGANQSEIARRFGVKPSTVASVLKRLERGA